MRVAGPQIYQTNRQIYISEYVWHAIGKNWPFGQENRFFLKILLEIAYLGVHESGLLDFGRPWTPNGWHQVNFMATPQNLGVRRFKQAMREVGDIKIEPTRARNIYFHVCAQKLAKSCFFG